MTSSISFAERYTTGPVGLELSGIRSKCFPDPSVETHNIAGQGWTLRELLLPALTLRGSAVEHNLKLQARWLADLDADQAPHAKTHLSPEIIRAQLDAGAWGVTVASVHQARLVVRFGVTNVILAHQVVDVPSIRALAVLLEANPAVRVIPLVDSLEGVVLFERVLAEVNFSRSLHVLVELGIAGGRTGVRSIEGLREVACAVKNAESLRLAGVEGFEGILSAGRSEAQLTAVEEYLGSLARAVRVLDSDGLFSEVPEILVTAGGSTFPDLVTRLRFDDPEAGALSRPHRLVVRSGGTVVHDHGDLAAAAPLAPEAQHRLGQLRPALELWAAVVSTPEPGVALLACGKRDAPYDSQLPVVLSVYREWEPISVEVRIDRLNDQHAFVHHDGGLAVGDVLRLGPCHPCTAFDKWAVIPVLSDDDRVIGAITTYF